MPPGGQTHFRMSHQFPEWVIDSDRWSWYILEAQLDNKGFEIWSDSVEKFVAASSWRKGIFYHCSQRISISQSGQAFSRDPSVEPKNTKNVSI